MWWRAVYTNHNPTLYITELSPLNHFFIMVAYPGHILESTKGIEIKLATYIVVMSWCTSGVGLQVLPFIDNNRLGSILHFQLFSCFKLSPLLFYLLHVYTLAPKECSLKTRIMGWLLTWSILNYSKSVQIVYNDTEHNSAFNKYYVRNCFIKKMSLLS